MSIITLTTDLGTNDSYLASVKGSIYSELSNVRIVDISNNINKYDIQQAAYIVNSCFSDFPKDTIHIISVNDELSISNEHLAVKAFGHYFIGADNGIFFFIIS